MLFRDANQRQSCRALQRRSTLLPLILRLPSQLRGRLKSTLAAQSNRCSQALRHRTDSSQDAPSLWRFRALKGHAMHTNQPDSVVNHGINDHVQSVKSDLVALFRYVAGQVEDEATEGFKGKAFGIQ